MPDIAATQAPPFAFESLKNDLAFITLRNKMDDWIQDEVNKHENMPEDTDEEQVRARRQKMRIRHFKELVGNIDQFITATIASKDNPKYKRRR